VLLFVLPHLMVVVDDGDSHGHGDVDVDIDVNVGGDVLQKRLHH